MLTATFGLLHAEHPVHVLQSHYLVGQRRLTPQVWAEPKLVLPCPVLRGMSTVPSSPLLRTLPHCVRVGGVAWVIQEGRERSS